MLGRLKVSGCQESGAAEHTLFIFSLNCWLNKAFTNELTAQLNVIFVSEIESRAGPMLSDVKYFKTYTNGLMPEKNHREEYGKTF